MSIGKTASPGLIALGMVLASATAAAQDAVGYLTEVSGAGATRGVDGPAFDLHDYEVYANEFAVRPGDRVVTLPAAAREDGSIAPSGATVFFPHAGVVVRIGGDSIVDVLPNEPLGVAVAVAVRSGSATVLSRSASEHWVLIAADAADGPVYLVARGATVRADASAPASGALELISGAGHLTTGPIPGGRVVDDQGQVIAGAGATENLAAAGETLEQLQSDSFAAGVERGADWIVQAEKGDFTPVRESARGSVQFFGQRVGGPDSAFDQPRAAPVAATPRLAVGGTRAGVVSPATPLLESRVPTSVVAGLRFRQTRIIGNPGAAASQIRVNPFLDPLLTLSGRGGN
ncbi:MAG: hypothetical protein C4547_13910 [Phycisphaerales bacterium]|nr:MAG: hypothetical protein C4547_13910 [Phycisphaerales bacterium]